MIAVLCDYLYYAGYVTDTKVEQNMIRYKIPPIEIVSMTTLLGTTLFKTDQDKIYLFGVDPNNMFDNSQIVLPATKIEQERAAQPETETNNNTNNTNKSGHTSSSSGNSTENQDKNLTLVYKSVQDIQVCADSDLIRFYSLYIKDSDVFHNSENALFMLDFDEKLKLVTCLNGVDFVVTSSNLYARGSCDISYCNIDEYLNDWTIIQLPFSASNIVQMSVRTNGILYLLADGSVYAIGENTHNRFCTEDPFYEFPTMVMGGILKIQLLDFTTVFESFDGLYSCGSESFTNSKPKQIKPQLISTLTHLDQLEACSTAIFARKNTTVYSMGYSSSECFGADSDSLEIIFENGKKVFSGAGGTAVFIFQEGENDEMEFSYKIFDQIEKEMQENERKEVDAENAAQIAGYGECYRQFKPVMRKREGMLHEIKEGIQ
ncbi:Regulator_of chromosome condensation 1/beta-lactamase-inhibitor protein II [Hexamita inflata]|uniref:Regulator of chromosome condensation 1/beta-lactamase-inhibitor protein II n=1 Tax=Hexamita inflata TaxID=28002 RepID=A0AA86UJR9_9EUKA|nr:Regulator of chromosome condensation 1/beta-lactamase-inhibitor protein II [Hexamita inflata]